MLHILRVATEKPSGLPDCLVILYIFTIYLAKLEVTKISSEMLGVRNAALIRYNNMSFKLNNSITITIILNRKFSG